MDGDLSREARRDRLIGNVKERKISPLHFLNVDAFEKGLGEDLQVVVLRGAQSRVGDLRQHSLQERNGLRGEVGGIDGVAVDNAISSTVTMTLEGRGTREQLVNDAPTLPPVDGSRVSDGAGEHFRRSIEIGAAERIGPALEGGNDLGEAKIGQLDVSRRVDQDIFGLDVSMQHIHMMHVTDGEDQLHGDVLDLALRESAALLQLAVEIAAISIFEDVEELVSWTEAALHVDDEVGLVQVLHDRSLVDELVQKLAARSCDGDGLDCIEFSGLDVPGELHLSEGSGADLLEDLEVLDGHCLQGTLQNAQPWKIVVFLDESELQCVALGGLDGDVVVLAFHRVGNGGFP